MEQIKILLIEDDADDIELLREAFKDNKINAIVDVVMEGDLVIPYLEACPALPDIIVMDFNLPKIHGRELLSLIRSSLDFSTLPIVVLTTSASAHDRDIAYENGANKFMTKPSTIEGFTLTVEEIVSVHKVNQG